MTDPKALIAEARETFGGHTAQEVAELLDDLAIAADRCDANSYSEISSISRRGSAAIRRLAAALEEAMVPEGWRVTRYDHPLGAIEYEEGEWHVGRYVADQVYIVWDAKTCPTAREAMAALDGAAIDTSA